MKIYDLCGGEGLAGGICRLEFVGWSLSVGVCRCRAARGGLNFKICSVCFDMLFVLMRYAAGGGNFIEDRSSSWCGNGDRLRFTRSFGS